MIRSANLDDLPAIRALFARANDAPYDLAAVAEEKCFGRGIAGEPRVRVWGDMQGVAVSCGKYLRILAVDRESRGRGIGSALLADAGSTVIAAEPGNYFTPGVVESDAVTQQFLRTRGYTESAVTNNLQSPLPSGERARVRGPRRALASESDRVLSFIEKNFGRIWRFETTPAFNTPTPTLFITEDQNEITGFAAHEVNNRGLGFFGPTGVAKDMRGRGLGCALLLASLADLRRLGYERAVIPWTDALDFYRKCSGAEPAHRFIAFAKPQP